MNHFCSFCVWMGVNVCLPWDGLATFFGVSLILAYDGWDRPQHPHDPSGKMALDKE